MKMIKNILLYAVYGGLFFIPFIPFIVPGAMFFPFITGKGFTFRILVEIIFGLYVMVAFLDAEYRPKASWITKAVLSFIAIILLADILGVNPYKSLWSNYERMEGFVLMAHLAMYYLVASSVLNTRNKWNWLFNTSILASVIMCIYGLFQAGGKLVINQGGDRVDGTLGNASYLAIYLVFHIFLTIYMSVGNRSPKWLKWVNAGIILLQSIVLAYTATRGAILGLIGGFILTGILVLWMEKENKLFRKIAYYTLGGLFAFILIFMAVRHQPAVQNNFILSRFANLSFSEIKTQGRYFVWPMALKGFSERPILGWGQENFNFVFNKYYDPRMFGQEQWFDRTHDIFLDWLIAGGVLGFLAYFSMYAALLYYLWRKESVFTLAEKSIFTGMMSAYLFHNIFVFDNLISYILFFTILSYVHAVSTPPGRISIFGSRSLSESSQYAIMPAVLIATVFMVYYVNIPALNANTTLIKAISPQGGDVMKNLALFQKVYAYDSFGSTEATEQFVEITSQVKSSQLPQAAKDAFSSLAKQKIEEKIAETPHDARYLVFAGSYYNKSADYNEAIKYLEKALAESPRKQSIFFELGTSYIGKGDMQKAFQLFKQAYDLLPTAQESKVIYALGAIYTKNGAALKEVLANLNPEIVINDNRFLQAYANIGDYQSAITILNERLKLDPKNPQTKISLASAYASIGNKQKAISIIQEVIQENPSFKEEGESYIKQIQAQ